MPNFAVDGELQLHADRRICSATSPARSRRASASTLADYAPGPTLTGTLPDGSTYSVPTYIPNRRKVTAGGNGFLTDELGRLLHRLPRPRVRRRSSGCRTGGWGASASRSTTRASTSRAAGAVSTPTATRRRPITEPLEGRRPVRAAERRQRRRHDLHQRQVAVQRQRDVPGAVRHRAQRERVRPAGLSVPDRSGTQALGADTGAAGAGDAARSTPSATTNVWNTDLRVARTFKRRAVSMRLIGDLFNVMNANTALVRNNNIAVDDVQPAGAEPQPADFQGRARRRVLSSPSSNARRAGEVEWVRWVWRL